MTCPQCQSANEPMARVCAACGATLARPGGLHEGDVIADRYEVMGPIGAGGMGMVYKAHDRVLEEDVAIKILRPEIADSADMTRRFRQEIKLARRVRHRNVCGIHEYGDAGGLVFIAMEYVEGVNLRSILRERGALAPAEAFAISTQVATGLEAIHEAGIIHRDLKSSNIMRDRRGIVRLMDFGIAKQHGTDVTLSGAGVGLIVGTPEYMSPEQARAEKLDFRSDIYSLGIVIYEIFTGSVPFQGDTPVATLMKHLNEPPCLTGPDAPSLPPPLVPVLARTLAKDPDERYGEASELVTAIREACRGLAPSPALAGDTPGLTSGPAPGSQPATATVAPATEADLASGTRTTVASGTRTTALSGTAPLEAAVAPSPSQPRWWIGAAIAALVLVVAAAVWNRTGRVATPPPPAAVALPATLVIDALPWGEVERIVDGNGRALDLDPDRYTPFVASLPPGDYVVSVRDPESARAETLKVTLKAAQLEKRVVAFQRIDAAEYLEKAGF